jgi:hypothetical protein
VSIVRSRESDGWEMKVLGPNGFERSYTLAGYAGEHQALVIGNVLQRLLPVTMTPRGIIGATRNRIPSADQQTFRYFFQGGSTKIRSVAISNVCRSMYRTLRAGMRQYGALRPSLSGTACSQRLKKCAPHAFI